VAVKRKKPKGGVQKIIAKTIGRKTNPLKTRFKGLTS